MGDLLPLLPSPDPPKFPYAPTFCIHAIEHNPPNPFGFPDVYHPSVTDSWLLETPRTQQVLELQPQETEWGSNKPRRTTYLTIEKTISVGEGRRSQLVLCSTLLPGRKGTCLVVAKIYDPLYNSSRSEVTGAPVDVVKMADLDYAHEAAAYRHLHTAAAGASVRNRSGPDCSPANYHGSWSFDLGITWLDMQHVRSVRMILIDYLAGPSIQDLYTRKSPDVFDAFHLTEEYRLAIMASILAFIQAVFNSGLHYGPISPRNVMVVWIMKHNELPELKLVFIDYKNAVVISQAPDSHPTRQYLNHPSNPAEYNWENLPSTFQG